MKKIFLVLAIVLAVGTVFSSCAAGKKDCRGVRHQRLSNGVIL